MIIWKCLIFKNPKGKLQLIRKCLGQANLEIYKMHATIKKGRNPSQYLDEALDHYLIAPKQITKSCAISNRTKRKMRKHGSKNPSKQTGIIGLPTWNWQILQRMKASGKRLKCT